MSTEIKTIKGTYHKHVSNTFKVKHGDAELYLTRFFNGKKRGTAIQLTISNEETGTTYIHLSKEQCKELSVVLNECFDYNKHPSE